MNRTPSPGLGRVDLRPSGQQRFGNVAAAGIEPMQPGPGVSFTLLDKTAPDKTLRVRYRGAVPDTFKAGSEVIVEGGMDAATGVFQASTLITKCPSKYQKQNRG